MREDYKSGFVAIIGRPNVGKSTLMNHLIGQKIAITSRKAQTTRNKIQTVYTCERGQIVFLDTPGIHKAKNKLGEYMVNVASRTFKDADVILWLVEPGTQVGPGDRHIAEQLKNCKLPVILVITSEHIGHQVVTGKIVGRDLLTDPGLHRTLFGDNFSTMLSGLIGSVPTTTYGENIGVMAVTRVYSVRVMGGAAVISILCSFIGKLSTLISTIPGPVIGGISFLLYGMIGTSGLRVLVDAQVDYGNSRNLALTSVIFVTGLSGIAVNIGNIQLTGMVLACVTAMVLSLVFYLLDRLHLTNDGE